MEKISNLFTMLTIAFCLVYITRELECKIKPIKIKSHGRKAKSIFKVGLEKITDAIKHSFVKVEEFLSIIKLLSCT
jgi:hypothetical protein